MKTIYNAIIKRLETEVPELRWIDLDYGQLDTNERPAVAFPCAIITINIPKCESITDTLQNCEAGIIVTLAFKQPGRTVAQTPDIVRNKSLEIYDTIANVYTALQGYCNSNFNPLDRTSQAKQHSSNQLFKYKINFKCEFEDATALGN